MCGGFVARVHSNAFVVTSTTSSQGWCGYMDRPDRVAPACSSMSKVCHCAEFDMHMCEFYLSLYDMASAKQRYQ
ncbi:hypothetical protein PR001_g29464 [Phytophthora rubi]|uniref:Uncharacterized protein n=1 Tax=Phytophthora rubi TaxID=129364 RepID=A0A6A3H143_9STRA|nr:hypothetical protein PR001_g29464 [Phytophthora rubi]